MMYHIVAYHGHEHARLPHRKFGDLTVLPVSLLFILKVLFHLVLRCIILQKQYDYYYDS